MIVKSVTAQFLPDILDANLCKNKQKQTNRTNTICLCLLFSIKNPFPETFPNSRIVDPEKKAYLVRNKNPSVIWILNDQNCSHPGYRDSILQSGSN